MTQVSGSNSHESGSSCSFQMFIGGNHLNGGNPVDYGWLQYSAMSLPA